MSSSLTNTQILQTQKALLSALDNQRKFILKIALEPMPCPACQTRCSQVEACDASQGDVDQFPTDTIKDSYHCTGCGRALVHLVLLFGGHAWALTTDEAAKLRRLLFNDEVPTPVTDTAEQARAEAAEGR